MNQDSKKLVMVTSCEEYGFDSIEGTREDVPRTLFWHMYDNYDTCHSVIDVTHSMVFLDPCSGKFYTPDIKPVLREIEPKDVLDLIELGAPYEVRARPEFQEMVNGIMPEPQTP